MFFVVIHFHLNPDHRQLAYQISLETVLDIYIYFDFLILENFRPILPKFYRHNFFQSPNTLII